MLGSWGRITHQISGSRPRLGGAVARVVEGAAVEREAAAADAPVQSIARALEHGDALLQSAADAPADRLPVGPRRRAALRQGGELDGELAERHAEPLGEQGARDAPHADAHD